MKIFKADKIKELDNYTIENEPISHIDLMERAASSVTYEIISHWRRDTPIVVFAGHGNNGGDALAVARMLICEGYSVITYIFNPTKKLSPSCEINLNRLQEMDAHIEEVIQTFIPPEITSNTVVVDGLFGSGINKPLSGGYISLVQYINESDAWVIAIDIPSGLFAEDNKGNNLNAIIRADITVTFQFPKLAFMFEENNKFVGELRVADIGISQDIIDNSETPYYFVESEDVAKLITTRSRYTDKSSYGHLLLVAGSSGMMGAAVLATKGALRSGAGLVSTHLPRCGEEIMQISVPEAIAIADTNLSRITNYSLSERHTAVAVGPGLRKHKDTIEALTYLINKCSVPMILDADALNIIADNNTLLSKLPKFSILTPHAREFDRLFGAHKCKSDRIATAIKVSTKYSIIIVIKGANSVIVTPLGELFFNSTGNAGMATAGSGDVLTGIIGGLAAQGYAPAAAAVLGVFIHGLAGDIAANELSQESLLAGDIVNNIGAAYKRLHSYKNKL